jgi:hypothetical protein
MISKKTLKIQSMAYPSMMNFKNVVEEIWVHPYKVTWFLGSFLAIIKSHEKATN